MTDDVCSLLHNARANFCSYIIEAGAHLEFKNAEFVVTCSFLQAAKVLHTYKAEWRLEHKIQDQSNIEKEAQYTSA